MADLTFPTLQEVVQRILIDAQNEFPESNPYLPNSYLNAYLTANAGRYYENFNQMQALFNLLFLTTTSDDFLDEWGSIFGLTRFAASPAIGDVTAQGVLGTLIPSGTVLINSSGDQYQSVNDSSVQLVNIGITLSRVGSVVTAVTANTHSFATGNSVSIINSPISDYNGTFTISVLDNLTFTYTISTTPATPTTGDVEAFIAPFEIQSEGFGVDKNLDSGATVSFQGIIPGITNNNAKVQIGGVIGGQDDETNDDYRQRLLFRLRNPVANFSVSDIEQQAFLVQGVTRVWVLPVTPSLGAVTVYFVRDNQADIIPTPTQVLEVRNSILEILPANMDESNLIVSAPIPVLIDFVFSSLSPDVTTLQTAVEANLVQFFKDNAGVGDDILKLAYDAAIFNTIDPETGDTVTNFTLSSPTGDITINSNEIGILNDVTFS